MSTHTVPRDGTTTRRRVPPAALPAAAFTGLFGLLTWAAVAGGPLYTADASVAAFARANAPSQAVADRLADLGNVEVALPVLALAVAFAWWRAPRRRGLRGLRGRPVRAVLATAAVPLLVVPLKVWTDRPAPPGPLGGDGYFPSGHTATALVAYGAAALVLLPLLRGAARRAAPAAAAVLTLAVSAGLVWAGYHWPADVAASWCLGGLLLLGVAARPRERGASGRTITPTDR